MTLLRCGCKTRQEPVVRRPRIRRHMDLWACPNGHGLQRRETNQKRRKA
jgi:hypothetical protein